MTVIAKRTRRQRGDASRGYVYRIKLNCEHCDTPGTFLSPFLIGDYLCHICSRTSDWVLDEKPTDKVT